MEKKLLIFATSLIFSSHLYADFKGSVTEVLDGGSVVVHSDSKDVVVKLNSIVTPFPNQNLYDESKQIAEKIFVGRDVTVITNNNMNSSCIHGELISDGVNLNEALLHTGFAWLLDPNSSPQRYVGIENQNRDLKKGLFREESRFQFHGIGLLPHHMMEKCLVSTSKNPIEAQAHFVAERDKYGFGYSVRAVAVGAFLGLVALLLLLWFDNLGLDLGISKYFKAKKKKDDDGFN